MHPRPVKLGFRIDIDAMAIRYLILQNHHRAPLNFSMERLAACRKTMRRLVDVCEATPIPPPQEVIDALADDLNTPRALALIAGYRKRDEGDKVFASLQLLGFFKDIPEETPPDA